MNDADRLRSEKEAARLWGVAPRTLRAWRKAGLIDCTYTPTGRVRYTLDQILAGKKDAIRSAQPAR
jgi:DNA-binding transcriptional MerR regulator